MDSAIPNVRACLGNSLLSRTGVNSRAQRSNETAKFMLRMLSGKLQVPDIESNLIIPIPTALLAQMRKAALRKEPFIRKRVQAVLFHHCGIEMATIMRVVVIGRNTIKRNLLKFKKEGLKGLLQRKRWKRGTKAENLDLRKEVLSILHAPPSAFGFNRTSWTIALIKDALLTRGHLIGKNNVSFIIKNAGFKFWKAKEVLTSNDPLYHEKVEAITAILAGLLPSERFFSIDEFGPFAVKQRGGRRIVPADEFPTVPQFQKSKGSLIVTAALELSTNQITHFYSSRKNTVEIIKMIDTLVQQYKGCATLYLSWDHASWHSSKKLLAEIHDINQRLRALDPLIPVVRLAPLPARSQFLNVIESVFSGMSAAIIENSNYESVPAARAAIDRYFADRNAHFQKNPKRAGKKIWGKEQVPATFDPGQNCKNPAWR